MFEGDVAGSDVAIASASFAAAVLAGLVVYWLIARKLRRTPTMTSWGGDEMIVHAIRDVVLVWFVALGLYVAGRELPLTEGTRGIVNRVLAAIAIAAATVAAARLASDAAKRLALKADGTFHSSSIFVNLARLTVVLVGLLMLLSALGVEISPLLGALGVGGLAIALALRETLSNLFAGLQVLASKQIRIGDYVRLAGGEEGYVLDLNWRNTSIRQLRNNVIIVPNAQLADTIIVNYSRPETELSVLVDVQVAYDSDLEHVERVTLEVARETLASVPGGVSAFEPLVRYNTFADSGIGFTVVLRAAEFVDQYLLKHEFIKRLAAAYRREGITIPYPVRDVRLPGGVVGDGAATRAAGRAR